MLVGIIAITFTALLYPRHIRRYPELTLLKIKRCDKGEMFSDDAPSVCKHSAPIFNIVSACLSHKRAIDLHLTDSRESS